MTDAFDPIQPDDADDLDRPYAEEPPELEDDAPRRAASARFVVESEVGSDAALRDAMDPANQSLAEALRLSFRVLQVVILVLVVLFLASGFKTVDDGESGVHTVWGEIDGQQALTPGPKFSLLPYPAGEFITFQVDNRSVNVNDSFAPPARPGLTQEQILERAVITDPPAPGRDGSLLTREGDIAHIEFSAKYRIEQPVEFVQNISDAEPQRSADRLVKLALQRATIVVAANSTLAQLTEPEHLEATRSAILQGAQEVLDGLDCGIRVIDLPDFNGYAALAIEKDMGNLQAAQVAAAEAVENAKKQANETLNRVAGNSDELLGLIDQYEDALEREDAAGSTQLLGAINEKFESEQAAGEVAAIIQQARAYRAQIESTLGIEYERFASLLPAFRQNPQLVVQQQWLDTFAQVVSQLDAEIIYVPPTLASLRMDLSGSAEVQERRRKDLLDLLKQQADRGAFDPNNPYFLRGSDMGTGHRQLPAGQTQPSAAAPKP